MDAHALFVTLDAIFLLAMTAWVGAVLFFSFGVAPIIFRVLEASQAAKFVRALFPRYYAWGATAATIALAAYTCGVLVQPEYRGTWALARIVLLLDGVVINLYCGNALTPRINAARDAGPEQAGRFDRLHRRSVRLNGMMLLIGVALIVAHAARPCPTGPGVTEPSPAERARRSAERWQQRQDEWSRRAPSDPVSERTMDPADRPRRDGDGDGLESSRGRAVDSKQASPRGPAAGADPATAPVVPGTIPR